MSACDNQEFSQDDIREALLELVDEGVLLMSVDPDGHPLDGTFVTFWFAEERMENRSDEVVAAM